MNRYLASYDLHLHSYYSYDACTSPAWYFEQASKLGLRAIAITDHHNFDVLPELKKTAKQFPDVGFFTGAEFTCKTPLGTMDFVCFGLPWEPTEGLKDLGRKLHQYQIDMGNAISQAISDIGGEYTEEERKKLLLGYRPDFTLKLQGITHVRNEIQIDYLIKKGVISSPQQWADLFWNEKSKYRQMLPEVPSADKVSDIVHQAGGVMLIAHPTGYFRNCDLSRMELLREFSNFDGIECAHPSTPPQNGIFWRKYCIQHHLLSSGGTDIHSDPEREYLHLSDNRSFAEHLGRDEWLDELCERVPLYHGRDL